jgi:signal transduction histidine kinase
MRKYLVLVLLCAIAQFSAKAQLQAFRYVNDSEIQLIDHPVYQYNGPASASEPELLNKENYIRLAPKVPNLGVKTEPIFLRFKIENLSRNTSLALKLDNPVLDKINLYEIVPAGLVRIAEDGEVFPYSAKKRHEPEFMFPLEFQIGKSREFLLEVSSGEQLNIPIQIGSPKSFRDRQLNKNIIFSIYLGIFFVMFIYNLFVYLSVRDKTYLVYVLNVLMVGMTQLVLNGYGNKFMWMDWEWMRLHDVYLFGAMSGITTVLFAQSFLKIKSFARILNYILNAYVVLYLISIVLTFFDQYNLAYSIINFNAAASFLLLIVAIIGIRKGVRAARFYLLAWTIFLFGVTLFVLKDFGILPYNSYTLYSLAAGSALEMILISIALADRINTLKKEKEESQLKALEFLRENQKFVKEQNTVLEAKVEERTRELRRSNSELKEALQNLKETQTQLVEAEKMASLGQLTAGIAHELNNPINFVSSNVAPLRRDVDEILELIDLFDDALDKGNLEEKLPELHQRKEELELPILREEIDKLLEGISIGASRTSEIVKGLRMFSRVDEQDLKKANILDCLESSLVILRSEIKHKATVVKDFKSVEDINCFPGKLNQVFVNLLSNSVHAIERKDLSAEQGTIHIKVGQDKNNIFISIKDNGAGMDENTRNRIFEPFFTTKSVGEGTGLGMSIVLGIINDHNGKIEVQSSLNVGTEIIITLPRNLR